MALGRPPVLKNIVEEHFEELDFLWEQRESVVFAPDWTALDLADLEERAEAHLDGLRLAELHAVDLALAGLAEGTTSAATAATFVLLETRTGEFVAEVMRTLSAGDDAVVEGIRIGLRHGPIEAVERPLRRLARSGEGLARAAAFDALAFHRLEVPEGLSDLLGDDDPGIRTLAYGAAGRVPGALHPRHLDPALGDSDAGVRRAALEAFARCGLPGLRDRCLAAATDLRGAHPEALAFLGVLGHPADVEPLLRGLEKAETRDAAIEGLGALGAPAAIPALIEAMRDGAAAEPAAAAFARITGFEDIRGERPPPDLEPESLEAEFGDPELGPVEAERARAWWDAHADAFDAQRLWQTGMDAGAEPGAPEWNAWPLLVRRDLHHRACAMGTAPEELELEARVAPRCPSAAGNGAEPSADRTTGGRRG